MPVPSAPTLARRSSDSLSLLIEIPPDYKSDYRIQFYEAGYLISSNWQTREIDPQETDSTSAIGGWDADGKPIFKDQAVYRLDGLVPNKV